MVAPPRPIAVIGTAGHVDHGKTSLVRALTGMETDRLPEEQARGISIELGFAWLDLPEGRVAFVDVPGHERFVRQMVAGAAGIDAVVLVVAADEGVMPQTREHLDICRLLGIRRGLVVLSRADLVDASFLELAREDVADLVRDTFLERAEVVPFSIHDPAGPPAVSAALSRLVSHIDRPDERDRPFMLAVDRAFSRPGFGTIVTGTSRAGALEAGDEVVVYPPGAAAIPARVRGLEVHGEPAAEVGPGQRVAINLGGVAVAEVPRGARLCHRGPANPQPASIWDVRFEALTRLPIALPDHEKGMACFGATVTEATLALFDRDAVLPGDTVSAQLRLAAPLALLPGERWIFRGFRTFESIGATVGGGVVLAPAVRKRKRGASIADFEALAGSDASAAIEAFARSHGEAGVASLALHAALPFARAALDAAVAASDLIRTQPATGGTLICPRALGPLADALAAQLEAFHVARPSAAGLELDELRTRLRPASDPIAFGAIVDALVRRGLLAKHGIAVALAGFSPRTTASEDSLDHAVEALLERSGLMPPRLDELGAALAGAPTQSAIDQAIVRLVAAGRAVRVQKDLVFAKAVLDRLESRLRDYFTHNEWLDAQALKELTGVSRKWMIPIGEWFDRARITLRVGDRRRLLR